MNTINVTKRDLTVKAKKLRRNGYVPGSVFGGMLKEPVALQKSLWPDSWSGSFVRAAV